MHGFSASCRKQWRLVFNLIAAAVMKCESDREMMMMMIEILSRLSLPISITLLKDSYKSLEKTRKTLHPVT
jgi:hypothetical protein